MARVLALTVAATAVVFCVVQDRVTAAGARQYVERQRAALAGRGPSVTLDEVMRPAIRRSVRQGVLWSGGAVSVGLAAAAVARRARRE